ncbi:glycosyltransferase [Flavobacteriales bacterium]|nr:glycosyltransferase [Flavobacteriales bacterium]
MAFPTVSVIIPVRNEAKRIRQCIEGILKQTVPVHEIIVIDSGSTDGTLDILTEFPQIDLIEIDGSTFNHGLTRNLGVERATGEFCQLTVGDAYAYNEFWLEEMLKGFVDDEVMAVCGQQVVDHLPENNPMQWFRPSGPPTLQRVQHKNDAWDGLSPEEKKAVGGWDDVIAMYRRNALVNQPFRETSYSEDKIWLDEAMRIGHAVVYNTAARVYHYHYEDADFMYRRTITGLYFNYRIFGTSPRAWQAPGGWKSKAHRFKWTFLKSGINPILALRWWYYQSHRFGALEQGIHDFIQAATEGEDALDNFHSELCGKPPIPVKQ